MELTFEQKKSQSLFAILAYIVGFYVVVYIIQAIISLIVISNSSITTDFFYNTLSLFNKYGNGDMGEWLTTNNFKEVLNAYTKISTFTNLVAYIGLFIAIIAILWKQIKEDLKVLKAEISTVLSYSVICLFIFYGINIITNILVMAIETIVKNTNMYGGNFLLKNVSENQASIELMVKDGNFIWIFIAAGLIGPIVEELIFRKSIFNIFKNPYLALIVSTFLFGSIHLITSLLSGYSWIELFISGISYYISGAFFCIIYMKFKKNIWIPIGVHMLSNIISLLMLLAL